MHIHFHRLGAAFLTICLIPASCNLGPSIHSLEGNWRLIAATCTSSDHDSCYMELQPCPSFYVFDGRTIVRHETSTGVTCTSAKCDTTITCYSSVSNPYTTTDENTIRAWGDLIDVTIWADTLLFTRHMENCEPSGTQTFTFVRENGTVPNGKPPCMCD